MYVLVKYRHSDCGSVGWFQMDIVDARRLFKKLSGRPGLYWFFCVEKYNVHYWNNGRWSSGVKLLKYA